MELLFELTSRKGRHYWLILSLQKFIEPLSSDLCSITLENVTKLVTTLT